MINFSAAMENKTRKSNKQFLLQYAGFTFQFLAIIGIAVFIGLYMDKCIKIQFPLFLWLLPLVVIVGMIIKVIKDTSKK
jgi:Na+/glutamate symporter